MGQWGKKREFVNGRVRIVAIPNVTTEEPFGPIDESSGMVDYIGLSHFTGKKAEADKLLGVVEKTFVGKPYACWLIEDAWNANINSSNSEPPLTMTPTLTRLRDDPIIGPMIDVTTPRGVQVQTNHDGSKLWVNIDGLCRLRVCQIPKGGLGLNLEHVAEEQP